MTKITSSILTAVLIFQAGCASYPGHDQLLTNTIGWDKVKKIDEGKLVYDKDRRYYKYYDKILVRDTHEKIRTREEALEKLQSMNAMGKSSVGEKIGYGATVVYAFPVAVFLGVLQTIAYIPIWPYAYYESRKAKKISFEDYREGKSLLQAGNYREARSRFLNAIEAAPALVQRSDIYYQIAETFDREKQAELANKYYEMFLDYSISLFPDYFPDYEAQFKDDSKELAKEFDSAESRITKFKNSQSASN